MAEWLVEQGIGEERAILYDKGQAIAARIHWPGELTAGQVEDARLVFRPAGSKRGRAQFASGEEALADGLPHDAQEGAMMRLRVTRSRIAERGRVKLAQAKPVDEPLKAAPSLMEALQAVGEARTVRRFPDGEWEDIWSEAWSGRHEFAGGSLHFSATPAMVLVDIDGALPPRDLALAAVPALAASIRRFDLAGSIGIDFPTLQAKADRKAVDAALEEALADFPHERTAMNGFGFVQIVARLEGPSLLHRFATSRVGMAARMALRRAEMVEGPGLTLLTVHPALKAKFKPEWLAELERRTARTLRVETDPALAIEAATAQIVPHDD